MAHLPLIIGCGGINPAGRTSGFNAYKRLVIDALPTELADNTLINLASLMNLVNFDGTNWYSASGTLIAPDKIASQYKAQILSSTLVRKLVADPEHGTYKNLVNAAGQLPSGFVADKLTVS